MMITNVVVALGLEAQLKCSILLGRILTMVIVLNSWRAPTYSEHVLLLPPWSPRLAVGSSVPILSSAGVVARHLAPRWLHVLLWATHSVNDLLAWRA